MMKLTFKNFKIGILVLVSLLCCYSKKTKLVKGAFFMNRRFFGVWFSSGFDDWHACH